MVLSPVKVKYKQTEKFSNETSFIEANPFMNDFFYVLMSCCYIHKGYQSISNELLMAV